MAFFLAVALSFIPAFVYAAIVYWLDRFEKEPMRLLVGAFIWGAVVSTLGAIIWTSVLQLGIGLLVGDVAADIAGTTILAPIVEEILKGLAVALIFLIFPHEFDSILDGMVYAAITALGFAATENVLYLYFLGYQDGGYDEMFVLFFLRVILGGWGHAVYSAFIGIGLAAARLTRNPIGKFFFPLLGLVVAIFLHALHNSMAVFLVSAAGLSGFVALLLVDWFSWLVALVVVLWAIWREQRWMQEQLRDEVAMGILSEAQYRTASSIMGQTRARMRGRDARHFYNACANLAQKKHQLARFGEENGNSARIAQWRAEVARLAPLV
ncbi:MAG: protease PrsW [Candidatus Viridilinea halotolerans]|uniref:Protease PrsW n=1 Tax=Candidatus Viridilinea halotolerans TaxID=2491704 RepID=A0A426TRI4_9CHLR|nr:MAG: protease PrsW [Candidatus Viridilinea halotolerans]